MGRIITIKSINGVPADQYGRMHGRRAVKRAVRRAVAAAPRGPEGPTKEQQALLRRLANRLPDTSAARPAPAPGDPVEDEHELAMRRYRMANHIPEPR